MCEAAFAMIDMARKRGCTVIVAGADATVHTQAYLDAGAPYILIGQGEETLGELMDHLVRRQTRWAPSVVANPRGDLPS
jgi:anaerobic magnesium-protoporphyrin IX monomethyl ester cyclase